MEGKESSSGRSISSFHAGILKGVQFSFYPILQRTFLSLLFFLPLVVISPFSSSTRRLLILF
jgi:hypothetical protein